MKPNTYTQIYMHLVFSVKFREAVLTNNIRSKVFEYMSGIITKMKQKSIIVNGISNHVHVLYGMNPNISVSDTIHDLKRGSSLFINDNRLCRGNFAWQDGYGAFSYSRSQLQSVYNYIRDQEIHHKKKTFREEYLDFLTEFEIDYREEYLFDFSIE